MFLTEQLQKQLQHYCNAIQEIYTSPVAIDKSLLCYYSLRMMEMKMRLERLGVQHNQIAYEGIRQILKEKYSSVLLEPYKKSLGWELPEKVMECARYIESNLSFFVKDKISPEEREELESYGISDEENIEDARDELEQQCFQLIIERETLDLIQKEMENWFPTEDFKYIQDMLWHVDQAFQNLYFPPNLQNDLQEYIEVNKVDTKKMPWFCRPTIAEIPPLLECDLEEIEAEAILDMVNKHPVPVPVNIASRRKRQSPHTKGKKIIYLKPSALSIAAGTEKHLIDTLSEEEIVYRCPENEYVSVRIFHHNSQLIARIRAKNAGNLEINWIEEGKQKTSWKKQKGGDFLLEVCQSLQKKYLLEIQLDGHLRFEETFQFQEQT